MADGTSAVALSTRGRACTPIATTAYHGYVPLLWQPAIRGSALSSPVFWICFVRRLPRASPDVPELSPLAALSTRGIETRTKPQVVAPRLGQRRVWLSGDDSQDRRGHGPAAASEPVILVLGALQAQPQDRRVSLRQGMWERVRSSVSVCRMMQLRLCIDHRPLGSFKQLQM